MPYSPWSEVAGLTDVIVGYQDLETCDALWDPGEEVILLDRGLGRVERRCALAHELEHRRRGHAHHPIPWFAGRQESQADGGAARRLIPVERLAEVLMWTLSPVEAAEELDVTVRLLRARLAGLTDAERGYIDSRMDEWRGA